MSLLNIFDVVKMGSLSPSATVAKINCEVNIFPNVDIIPRKLNEKDMAERRIKKLHVTPGTIFMNRWSIEGLIGSGGYGQIYLTMDLKKREERAAKIETKLRGEVMTKRIFMELQVLLKMQGKRHVPLIYASGYNEQFNFIIMQLLSENVGDIRKRSPNTRLSKGTVGRIAFQTVDALKDIHEIGYLHRDVKPANICFGIHNQNRQILYLLDFGLLRRFKSENGSWLPPRQNAGFKGTERYVSVRVHEKMEQTPWDDVFSVMYTAYELVVGELPWRYLEDVDEIFAVKKLMNELDNNGELFKGVASVLVDFHKLLVKCDPKSDLPYECLMESLKKMFHPKTLSDLYDWEDGFKNTNYD